MVREISGGLHFSYTRQSEALGLGHAVLCAAELVGDEPFAVLLGDVIMEGAVPATRGLKEIYEATGAGAIHVECVPRERVHFYGIVDAAPAEKNSRWGEKVLRVKDLVEKPSAEKAPSNLGITGRYVLPPEIFEYLAETKPGAGGEIQLTDGLRRLAAENRLMACIYDGRDARCGRQTGISPGHGGTRAEKSEAGRRLSRISAGTQTVTLRGRHCSANKWRYLFRFAAPLLELSDAAGLDSVFDSDFESAFDSEVFSAVFGAPSPEPSEDFGAELLA